MKKNITTVFLVFGISVSNLFGGVDIEIEKELQKEFIQNHIQNSNNSSSVIEENSFQFEEVKEEVLKKTRVKIKALEIQSSCIEKSNSFEDLKRCKDEAIINLKRNI